MKTKITFIMLFLIASIKLVGQEETQLSNKDGVKITYQLLLEDQGKKKDSYLLIVNATNTNDKDLYYKVALNQNQNGQFELPYAPSERGFTKITVRNSTGLFGDGQSIIGNETKLMTTNNEQLFKIGKGDIYSQETTFKVKKGIKPLLTNLFNKTLQVLEDFDLKISQDMLDGNYTSSCGDLKVNISTQNSEEKGEHLIQTTNGKQFVWLQTTESTFERENNTGYTLVFNKKNNTYTYATSDGITCTWTKN